MDRGGIEPQPRIHREERRDLEVQEQVIGRESSGERERERESKYDENMYVRRERERVTEKERQREREREKHVPSFFSSSETASRAASTKLVTSCLNSDVYDTNNSLSDA